VILLKNAVFWDVTPCGSCKNDVSEERIASIFRVINIDEMGTMLAVTSNRSTLRRLLVKANVVPTSPIAVTLIMKALRSSETSVLTRATCLNIPQDVVLHSYRRVNLKSYIVILVFHYLLLCYIVFTCGKFGEIRNQFNTN
jgi:hypothetical protein